MKNKRKYLNTNEAAEFIGRTPAAVRILVLRRAIPYRKPTGRLVFLRSELEEWIESADGVTMDELHKMII